MTRLSHTTYLFDGAEKSQIQATFCRVSTAMEDQDRRSTPPPSATTTIILSTTPPHDPPPPYPSRERRGGRTGTQRRRRRTLVTAQGEDGDHLHVPFAEGDEHSPASHEHFSTGGGDESGNEHDGPPHSAALAEASSSLLQVPTSPTISPPSPRIQTSSSTGGGSAIGRRPRTLSMTSTLHSVVSAAPSFAQTVLSAFHPDRDEDLDPDCSEGSLVASHEDDASHPIYEIDIEDEQAPLLSEYARLGRRRHSQGGTWYRYFRPMFKRAYYSALFHLLLLNFPYALTAWVYLFVFTLVNAFLHSHLFCMNLACNCRTDGYHDTHGPPSWRSVVLP